MRSRVTAWSERAPRCCGSPWRPTPCSGASARCWTRRPRRPLGPTEPSRNPSRPSPGRRIARPFQAAVVGAGVSPAGAALATLTDDAHTSGAQRAQNFGSAPSLLLQGPGAAPTRVYLRFDLSTLPAGTRGSDVGRALLRLWVSGVTKGGMFDVHTVKGGWTEGAITGANAPPPGRDEIIGVPVTPRDRNTFVLVDLTDLVRDWLDRA